MGSGLICSQGEAPQRLRVGDVVHVPAGEMHWHGATRETVMAHMAVSLGSASAFFLRILFFPFFFFFFSFSFSVSL